MTQSGQAIAQRNVLVFESWVQSKTDDDFRAMAIRGVLSRKEISTECGFAKSVLDQNPRIKASLRSLEDALRLRGVLPVSVERPDGAARPLIREQGTLRNALDAERLRRLEIENASLNAQVTELKRLLEKHVILKEALALTGRIPR